MQSKRIGFVGAGQMAQALAGGFVSAGLVASQQVWASDPQSESLAAFKLRVPEANLVADNAAVAEHCEVLVLAVKPQYAVRALESLRPVVSSRHLVVSIAAGISLKQLARQLGEGVRLVRVMPNTPCLVGLSASGYALGPGATTEDAALVGELFSAVGTAYQLEEQLLDAVTGLAGSGPAFVYLMIEALSDGGVRMGLPRHIATGLAAQTVRGAAEMVLATGEHTGVLRDRVASPGGTTIAGLQALEVGGVRAAFMAAVVAAAQRSSELGQS